MKLITLLLFLPMMAQAAGGGHGSDEIPGVVFYQALNISVFILILFFALKNKAIAFFRARFDQYNLAQKQADAAKQAAEKERNDIRDRLNKLVQEEAASLQRAQQEAKDLQDSIVTEAREYSRRIHEEAQKTIRFELDKAKAELRAELLSESMTAAKNLLAECIQDLDQKRLQREFIDKIKVVQQ